MIAIVFFTSYYLSYLQLLLYPLSNISLNWAYRGSSEHPDDVFYYLHRSSLYWNKRFPLESEKLIKLLSIAVQCDPEQALKEINYILTERSQLISVDELVQLLVVIAEQDP